MHQAMRRGKQPNGSGYGNEAAASVNSSNTNVRRAQQQEPQPVSQQLTQSHTVMLVQFHPSIDSRTYLDYDTIGLALDGVCQLFEQSCKEKFPSTKKLTYDVSDLFEYVDSLPDLCCFVKDLRSGFYAPHDKEWIKNEMFTHLKAQIQIQ